jgi:tryptophan 2,3-dioxygenase
MTLKPEILEKISLLEKKYEAMGQDMGAYLDGLLYSDPTFYWEYVGLDTLLTLQRPKTDFPDEFIFIVYHQINELYFRLSLHELNQLAYNGKNISPMGQDLGWQDKLSVELFTERIRRVNSYFEGLTKSFDIMIHGMEKEQFLKFRMALLPASGFQSAQYRSIEVCATDLINLIQKDQRAEFVGKPVNDQSIEKMFEYLYWKQGATEMGTGKKTLTLKQFEQKYTETLLELCKEYQHCNMWQKYKSLSAEDQQNKDLVYQLKRFDVNVNINWPLVHYKSAVRYLQQDKSDVAATGGTNWQQYLPPRFQKRIFYPELWTDEEKAEWGKSWVEENVIKK